MSTEFETIRYLVEDVKRPETVEVDGRIYQTKGLSPILDPMVKCLTIHTLQGIVDFLTDKTEILNMDKIFIHVKNYNEVNLMEFASGQWKQREFYLQATLPDESRFPFDRWISVEDMIIELHAKMVPGDNVNMLVSLLSRVEDGIFNICEDDGISQEITVKRKVQGTMTDIQKAPPRVDLSPYRTFLEVDQPSSQFVFRLRKGMEAALFDADSGKWKLEAIKNISNFFQNKLPEIKIIA